MSRPEWTADIDIDVEIASELVGAAFPELRGLDVTPFGNGWDNAAFLVDASLVFRFPRRRAFAGLIEREASLCPAIAANVPLRISSPTHVAAPTSRFPWVFSGYPLIDGTTLCSADLSRAERIDLAAPLAQFLRALHAIDPVSLVNRGLEEDDIGRLDFEKRLSMTRAREAVLDASGEMGLARFTAWMAEHPPRPIAEAQRKVVHGDLYARHIVLNGAAPAGIIDWDDVHFGDAALDLAVGLLVLPPEAYGAFRMEYGGIDDATWDAARFRAIYHAFLELEYGLREGDKGMRAAGVTALAFLGE